VQIVGRSISDDTLRSELQYLARETSALLPEVLADRICPQVACLACKHQEEVVDRRRQSRRELAQERLHVLDRYVGGARLRHRLAAAEVLSGEMLL
jgi:hypothetical protein